MSPFGEPPPYQVGWDKIREREIRADRVFTGQPFEIAPQEPPVERNSPAMLVLRPGDKVLVCLHDDPPPEEAQEWARQLHTAFRGVEFVIAGGVAGLAVLGGGDRG